jgi:hypothetical protein
MKKPTLRLRQVFEGPTHFKVVRPLGNPIKIAKKGLSPNLMGRLRKYAEGTPDEPVQPPTPRELETALALQDEGVGVERVRAKPLSIQPAEYITETEPTEYAGVEGEGSVVPSAPVAVEPAVPVAPLAVVAPAPVPAPVATAPRAAAPAVEAEPVLAEEEPAVEEAPAESAPTGLLLKALDSMGITQEKLQKMPDVQRMAALNLGKQLVMQEELNKVEVAAAEGEVGVLKAGMDAQAEELKQLNTRAKEARDIQKSILEEMDYLKNPGNYFSRMGTLGQIGSAISLALGAFASGMTGMPNFAQKIFDNAIEQDLAEQKRRSDSLYQRLVAAGHTVEGAEDLVRAQLKLIGASQQGIRAAQVKLPQVKARMQVEIAKQVNDAVGTMARVASQERTATAAERRADIAESAEARMAAKAPVEQRRLEAQAKLAEGELETLPTKKAKLASEAEAAALRPQQIRADMKALNKRLRMDEEKLDLEREKAENARQDRLDAAKNKQEEDRIARGLTVGDSELELKTKLRAPLIRDQISYRQQALLSLIKLDRLIDEAGGDSYEIWKPGSTTRGAAMAELNLAIENFSKGAGFPRAISVAAKELLIKAAQEPESYKTLFKKIFADRDPGVGIKSIKQEVQRGLEEEIRSQTRNSQQEIDDALSSWYKNADKLIKKYEQSTVADEEL